MALTTLRIKRGHRRQNEIAAKAGLIPSRYNMIESGKTKHVPADVARRIAAALGEDVETLFLPSSFMSREVHVDLSPVGAEQAIPKTA